MGYYNLLLNNLAKERIDGHCLHYLDKHHIILEIQRLIKNECKNNHDPAEIIKQERIQKEEMKKELDALKLRYNHDLRQKECVICLDNKRTHCCVPCGHKCLCEQCKDLTNGKCPICQRAIDSFIKVYDDKS